MSMKKQKVRKEIVKLVEGLGVPKREALEIAEAFSTFYNSVLAGEKIDAATSVLVAFAAGWRVGRLRLSK